MKGRKELTDRRVRDLVYESIELIGKVQSQLRLPISPHLYETYERLREGNFRSEILNKRKRNKYSMDFGNFIPPSTIVLDRGLPMSDRPLDLPELARTLTTYSAVHEVIHADDHTGGDQLLLATRDHIVEAHQDKLAKSMDILKRDYNHDCICGHNDLACLWAIQYVDMVTHYRAYVVLRQLNYPKLEHIWSRLRNDYFSPNLLTCIEVEKGAKYVFSLFTERVGEYCLIEALQEYKAIKERDACKLIV